MSAIAQHALVQVLTSVAQVADLMAPLKRSKPLHVVADSRRGMLEEFADRLHMLRAAGAAADEPGKMLLTTDILPTETLSAGAPRRFVLLSQPTCNRHDQNLNRLNPVASMSHRLGDAC